MTSMSTQSPAGEGRGEPLSVPQGLRAAHVPTKTSVLWGLGWHLNNSCCAVSPGILPLCKAAGFIPRSLTVGLEVLRMEGMDVPMSSSVSVSSFMKYGS